jgi:3-hydroxyisobutyrate dehydrogenase-like beta-hydroxyacid dehydrogenase
MAPLSGAERIGFIGLGLMGRPMAGHLLGAGLCVVVHNRSRTGTDALLEQGAEWAASPREVAERVGTGVTVLMLTNTASVRQVIEGDGKDAAYLPAARAGSLIIDMGSTGVEETRQWAAASTDRGLDWLDAPVSGGQLGAVNRTLTIMAGGERRCFDRAAPLLNLLGNTLTYIGPSGTGQAAKLANQIIVASTIAAVAEALTLARAAGADLSAVRRALLGGFAASRILDLHGQRMIDRNFVPGGRGTGQLKDVLEADRLARDSGLNLPLLQTNVDLWRRMVDAGLGELDHSALIQLYEQRQPNHPTKDHR